MIDQVDAIVQRAQAKVGQVLRDKWRVEGLLGVGGMAVVYTATHTNNGRRVAIKMLHPELSMTNELRNRFLREGYVANKIAHPGSVSILDDDVAEDGSVFLVMELLEGETIEGRRIRKGGVLVPGEIMSICDQVLDTLAAAHEKGIVHRDVKPDNIFLTKDGGVKLLDFGIARIRELQNRAATLTGAGSMGTPAFMPQEQARGRWDAVGPKTDIWALGATMFTLTTGRTVHEAETLNEVLLAAMTKPAPALATIAPGLPPPFCALVDRALAYEIEERWKDARAMQLALREAYQAISAIGDGPTTNRGLGERPERAEPIMPLVPQAALATGPRPPPEFELRSSPSVLSGGFPAASAQAARGASPATLASAADPALDPRVRSASGVGAMPAIPSTRSAPQQAMPFAAEPSTTSGVVLGVPAAGPHAPGQMQMGAPFPPPPLAAPRGVPGAGIVAASHATTHSVAIATRRSAYANKGLGVVLAMVTTTCLVGAVGVYAMIRNRSAGNDAATESAATNTAAPPAGTAAEPPVPAASAASAEPSDQPSAAPEPSSAPSSASDARPTPRGGAAPAEYRPKRQETKPKNEPAPAHSTKPPKSEKDLLNRRN